MSAGFAGRHVVGFGVLSIDMFVCRGVISWHLTEYSLVNLDLLGFRPFPWEFIGVTRNDNQEQHSLLDTVFVYIFYFEPPGKYLY